MTQRLVVLGYLDTKRRGISQNEFHEHLFQGTLNGSLVHKFAESQVLQWWASQSLQ